MRELDAKPEGRREEREYETEVEMNGGGSLQKKERD